jgi:hypothetical protein
MKLAKLFEILKEKIVLNFINMISNFICYSVTYEYTSIRTHARMCDVL